MIAEGTSDELKARVGGERLEVTLEDPSQAAGAVDALSPMCADPPEVDGPVVRMAFPRRSGVIAEAVRALDDAGVGIADLAVRRPTLDDVFLALTGHAAEPRTRRHGPARGAGAGRRCGRERGSPRHCPTRWCWPGATCCASPGRPTCCISFTVQPIMFVLLFVYVFGGAISTPGYDYVDFLMPGIIVQTMAFGGFVTALGLAEDLKKGLIDRFRSLPMSRSAVLAGRTLADVGTNMISLVVMLVVGVLVGLLIRQQPARDPGRRGAAAALRLRLLLGVRLLGLSASSAEAAQALGFIAVFPLTFASSAFVPRTRCPSWLQTFAEVNPITTVVDAIRALWIGSPAGTDVYMAVIWSLGLIVVFGFLVGARYRRAVTS